MPLPSRNFHARLSGEGDAVVLEMRPDDLPATMDSVRALIHHSPDASR